jgi:hypothetical protein
MNTTRQHPLGRRLVIFAAAAAMAACAESAPLAPDAQLAVETRAASAREAERDRVIATIRSATARYHDLDVAVAEGFVFLHGCENRPDEGPVGMVYVHMGRLTDGVIDPETPDALIYEPRTNERPRLVGVEMAIPYALWTEQEPPRFLGAEFQPEDEFGVFGLHIWSWRNNPEGLFAESNPRVSCGTE